MEENNNNEEVIDVNETTDLVQVEEDNWNFIGLNGKLLFEEGLKEANRFENKVANIVTIDGVKKSIRTDGTEV